MINLITNIPKILGNFLDKFKDLFSQIQFKGFKTYIAGLLQQHRRVSVESIASVCPNINYQNLQYFLSESKYDTEQINNCRLKILQQHKPTKATISGVAVIDDTSCKKWGTHTEGAKPQYSSTEKGITNCNVTVMSAYCDSVKRYPINIKPYKTEQEFSPENISQFKSKIELACELVDDLLEKKIPFSDLVFDSWYFAEEVINHVEKSNLTWITDAQIDRLISFKGKWTRAGELSKLIPSVKFTEVNVSMPNKESRKFVYYSFITKIKGLKNKVRIVIVKGSFSSSDPKEIRILVTNHLSLSPEAIIQKYACRWGIECIFRDMKENTGFDQYQVHSLKSISRHWQFSILSYSFLLRTKLSSWFERTFSCITNTIGDCLRAFRKLNLISCKNWILNHKEQLCEFLQLKNPKLA